MVLVDVSLHHLLSAGHAAQSALVQFLHICSFCLGRCADVCAHVASQVVWPLEGVFAGETHPLIYISTDLRQGFPVSGSWVSSLGAG